MDDRQTESVEPTPGPVETPVEEETHPEDDTSDLPDPAPDQEKYDGGEIPPAPEDEAAASTSE